MVVNWQKVHSHFLWHFRYTKGDQEKRISATEERKTLIQ